MCRGSRLSGRAVPRARAAARAGRRPGSPSRSTTGPSLATHLRHRMPARRCCCGPSTAYRPRRPPAPAAARVVPDAVRGSSPPSGARARSAELRGTCVPLGPVTDPTAPLWRVLRPARRRRRRRRARPDRGTAHDPAVFGSDGSGTVYVVANGGHLVSTATFDVGDAVSVFGFADESGDRSGLAPSPHGRGGLPAPRSAPAPSCRCCCRAWYAERACHLTLPEKQAGRCFARRRAGRAEAAGRSGDARAPRAARRRILAAHPRLRERRRGRVPRPQVAGEELDHQRPQAAGDARGAGLRGVHRGRAARLRARADERARVAVPAVADRLERPVRRSAAPSSSRSGSRLLPDHPQLDLDSLHERADAPVPGLTHRYPDKALFLRARHLPGLLPLLHAQLRGRHRHRGGREGPAQGQRRALAAGVRVHPLAPRARGHRHLRRRRYKLRAEQITQIGETLLAIEHPPHALRDQGPGGDAAEDPHRRRVDRRAHRRGRAGPQAPQGGRAPHALQPPERDHGITKAAMDQLFERGITVRNQAVLQRGVNDSSTTMRCWSSASATSTCSRTTSTCTTS